MNISLLGTQKVIFSILIQGFDLNNKFILDENGIRLNEKLFQIIFGQIKNPEPKLTMSCNKSLSIGSQKVD
jgi:hypothetical protein